MTRDTVLTLAEIGPDDPVAEAVTLRQTIFEMTHAAEAAVLRPAETGRWPHALRAALAARIAALNGETALAALYSEAAGDCAPLADPNHNGAAEGLAPVLAFMDKVATQTRDVAAEDIALLQGEVADADIVRLCELNAFLAYQIRVLAGLRLMAEARS